MISLYNPLTLLYHSSYLTLGTPPPLPSPPCRWGEGRATRRGSGAPRCHRRRRWVGLIAKWLYKSGTTNLVAFLGQIGFLPWPPLPWRPRRRWRQNLQCQVLPAHLRAAMMVSLTSLNSSWRWRRSLTHWQWPPPPGDLKNYMYIDLQGTITWRKKGENFKKKKGSCIEEKWRS